MLYAVVYGLIVEVEPAPLSGYLFYVLTVIIHFVITRSYHLTVYIADGIDDNMRMELTAVFISHMITVQNLKTRSKVLCTLLSKICCSTKIFHLVIICNNNVNQGISTDLIKPMTGIKHLVISHFCIIRVNSVSAIVQRSVVCNIFKSVVKVIKSAIGIADYINLCQSLNAPFCISSACSGLLSFTASQAVLIRSWNSTNTAGVSLSPPLVATLTM